MTNTAQRTLQAHPAPIEHAQYGGTDYHRTRAELARQVAQAHGQTRAQSD